MFYKIIFIDLDGTLLSKFDNISLKNLSALKKYKELGGEIVLCTGRWSISSYKFNKIIEDYSGFKNKYLSCLNGSLIYDLQNKKIINQECINKKIYDDLFLLRKKYRVRSFIYSEEGIQNKIIHSFRIPLKKIIGFFNSRASIQNTKTNEINNFSIYKILFFSLNRNKIIKFLELLSNNFSKYLHISRTSKNSIEITSLNSSKGNAVKKILKILEISKEQSASFGDSGNDLSMFEETGLKMAVNSSNQDLLKLATYSIENKNPIEYGINNYLINNVINFKKENMNLVSDICYLNLDILNKEFENFSCIEYFLKLKGNLVLKTSECLEDINYKLSNISKYLKIIFCNNNCSIYSFKEKKFLFSKSFSDTQIESIIKIFKKEWENNANVIFVFYLSKNKNYIIATSFSDYEIFIKEKKIDRHVFRFIELNDLLRDYIRFVLQIRIYKYKYKLTNYNNLTIREFKDFLDINPDNGFIDQEENILNLQKFLGNTVNIKFKNNLSEKKELDYLSNLNKEIKNKILL